MKKITKNLKKVYDDEKIINMAKIKVSMNIESIKTYMFIKFIKSIWVTYGYPINIPLKFLFYSYKDSHIV